MALRGRADVPERARQGLNHAPEKRTQQPHASGESCPWRRNDIFKLVEETCETSCGKPSTDDTSESSLRVPLTQTTWRVVSRDSFCRSVQILCCHFSFYAGTHVLKMNSMNEILLFLINIFFYIVFDFLMKPETSDIREPVFWKCSCRGYGREKGTSAATLCFSRAPILPKRGSGNSH